MRRLICLLALLTPSALKAQASMEDLQEIYERAGIEVDARREAIVPAEAERALAGDRSIDRAAAARAMQAIETTYRDAGLVGLGASDPDLNVFGIEQSGRIVIARFYLPVVGWPGAAADPTSAPYAATETAINAVLGEPLTTPVIEIVELAWESLATREPIATVPNTGSRVFAWGVPPDFVQIVVTTRPDCEPLRTNNWLARHLCP